MKTLEQEWLEYASKVLPKGCSPIQRQETRRAYYAGIWTLLQMVKELGDEEVSEEQGAQELDKLENECASFISQVGKKY
ncbi:hypothetical protein [Nostoc sp. JL23]|uniref:hypothetical protein n=1 Tax=Nostoc sp. JL23 TaxID=2815394 RepID=UPI001D23DE91|nr:hypothetical protein [Nostoc sp. JL23]MBN3875229.1 hypothetical protein [Nostoc sp. JL23]